MFSILIEPHVGYGIVHGRVHGSFLLLLRLSSAHEAPPRHFHQGLLPEKDLDECTSEFSAD
jgi:hypothetical protein